MQADLATPPAGAAACHRTHLDVGGDTAVEQAGNLDHVEVCEEVNVFDPRDPLLDPQRPEKEK